jgi:hypothetical protein
MTYCCEDELEQYKDVLYALDIPTFNQRTSHRATEPPNHRWKSPVTDNRANPWPTCRDIRFWLDDFKLKHSPPTIPR